MPNLLLPGQILTWLAVVALLLAPATAAAEVTTTFADGTLAVVSDADDATAAQAAAQQVTEAFAAMLHGLDADSDGQIAMIRGECGAEQIHEASRALTSE